MHYMIKTYFLRMQAGPQLFRIVVGQYDEEAQHNSVLCLQNSRPRWWVRNFTAAPFLC